MKKLVFFIAIFCSLMAVSCENASVSDDSADSVKAAQALKLVNDGMVNAMLPAGTKADVTSTGLPDLSSLSGEIYNNDGMVITAEPVADFEIGSLSFIAGVKLVFEMTGYSLQLDDGIDRIVTGTMELVAGYNILSSEIVILVNTPADSPLEFTGGELDGQVVGFEELEMRFSTSGMALGSPVSVTGTILINDLPVYVDSEILELLMGMI